MNKLWDFNDYVNHLTHRSGIVRRWALDALDNRFPYKYDDPDFLEAFAGCLKGIGDKRGIETLQAIYAYMVLDCPEVENSLECLSEIHQVEIPELPEINKSRRKRYERQRAKKRRLNKLAENYIRQRK